MSAYTVPTETPEADGTLAWNETTLVLVRVSACGARGFGYSFADIATAHLIDAHLKRDRPRRQLPEYSRTLVRHGARHSQPRPAGDLLDGHFCR